MSCFPQNKKTKLKILEYDFATFLKINLYQYYFVSLKVIDSLYSSLSSLILFMTTHAIAITMDRYK